MQLRFGKHRGQHIAEVPSDYLRWILVNLDLFEWQSEAIQAELDRREADEREDLQPVARPAPSGAVILKDDILPLTTQWYASLLERHPDGRVLAKVAHQLLMQTLGLDRFDPVEQQELPF